MASRQVTHDHRTAAREVIAETDRLLNPQPTPEPTPEPWLFDERVRAAGSSLFKGGHYTRAVHAVWEALIAAVREKSGKTDMDNSPLMEHVFNRDNPILRLYENPNEQRGVQGLFAGSVLAIRNRVGHTHRELFDRDEAMEIMAFASYLFRLLDRSEKVRQ
jgi:uncharacterized protein (TIGR02391 family)